MTAAKHEISSALDAPNGSVLDNSDATDRTEIDDRGGRANILSRVRQMMRIRRLDAYLAYTPSNVLYVTGFESYFLSHWWRMHGNVLALVPADGDKPVSLMVGDAERSAAASRCPDLDIHSYPMWVDTGDLDQVTTELASPPTRRPAQFNSADQDEVIDAMVRQVAPQGGRIGTDLEWMSASLLHRLREIAPAVEWIDATADLYEIRAIKESFEVDRLATAAELAEAGMKYAAGRTMPGMGTTEVRGNFFAGVGQHVTSSHRYRRFSDLWVIPAVGAGAAIGDDVGETARAGDLLKFDCGTTVDGYRSDSGRTFAIASVPTDQASKLYGILRGAHQAAVDQLRPGARACEVFAAAENYARTAGLRNYNRGHFGHSVGLDTFHEEPPFLSAADRTELQSGMVLAVETPFYGSDVGAIMIEDLVRVTPQGPEFLTHLPRELLVTGR